MVVFLNSMKAIIFETGFPTGRWRPRGGRPSVSRSNVGFGRFIEVKTINHHGRFFCEDKQSHKTEKMKRKKANISPSTYPHEEALNAVSNLRLRAAKMFAQR